MKQIILFLTLVATLAGCKKSPFQELTNGPEVTLGALSVTSNTKAATTAPLPKGYRFRLYVLPAGVNDLARSVATRTYTIVDGAGKPSLDAGQDPLTLAVDEFDTYIVGPLMGVDAGGNAIEIAGSASVNCVIGNDIVSCFTPLSVGSGSNVLTPAPLNHRMAKAEMVIQRTADASYTELAVEEITLDAQPTQGTFVLSREGITITPVDATAATRKWVPTLTTDPATPELIRYSSVDYLFPQASKELKITTTFDAKTGSDTKKYQQSGLVTTALAVGTQHRFMAEPITPVELVWRLKLVPWVDQSMSGIEMNNDVVFYYSGQDAPIYIDGAQYWPDRSGNDRHAKIVNDIVHDPVERCYRLKDGAVAGEGYTSYLLLPKLGKMDNYTIELHYKSSNSSNSIPVGFGMSGINNDPREFALDLPFSSELSAIEGGIANDRRLYVDPAFITDKSIMETMATWSFTRTPAVERKVYRNGVEMGSKITAPYDLNFDARGTNTLFTKVNASDRLYAVRMYRRVLTQSEILKNSDNDRELYSKAATSGDGYVESGLLLNLQGDKGPSTSLVAGKTVWPDQSRRQNHAVYTSSSSSIVYNRNTRSYKFSNKANDLMKLLKPLGDLTNATVEMVLHAAGNTQNSVLFFADDNTSSALDNRRVVHMHYPYGSNIDVNFTNTSKGETPLSKAYTTFTYSDIYNQTLQYSIVRDAKVSKTLALYQNNIQQTSTAVTADVISSVYEGYIGGQITNQMYEGHIMALRVYDRPLTDAERRINYGIDRQKYDLIKPLTTDLIVGNFAGSLVSKQVGVETWYYFDKTLFVASANENDVFAWQTTASVTNLTDKWTGKANTLALKNLGNAPAAMACWNKASTPSNSYYLPAQNQLMGLWLAKPALGLSNSNFWSSSEDRPANSMYVDFTTTASGIMNLINVRGKTTAYNVRCVRDGGVNKPVAKVIKDINGKVYIDVQDMLPGTFSTSSLSGAHTEKDAKNSIFKRFEIDKSNKPNAPWANPGCGSGWRLPTQKELMLVWIMKDALVQAGVDPFGITIYWCATGSSTASNNAWWLSFADGVTSTNANSTTAFSIRCVREVN